MGSQAFAGVGTKFQRWNGTTWDDIAEVNAIEGPGMTKDTLEVTSLDTDAGYNEFITGFAEGGTVTLDMNFTRETYELMKEDFESDNVVSYRIQLADYDLEPSTFTFGGLVIELPMGISADDKVTADVVIQVTSQVILDIGSTVPAEEGEAPQRTSQVIQNATPSRLDINYDQTLDSGSIPATSAFTVMVAGSPRTVNSVAISGSQVRLTLASAVTYGQVVTVAYTVPGTNPIQNTTGIDAVSYTAVSVTNNVQAVEASSSGVVTIEDLMAMLDDGHTWLAYDHNLDVTIEDTDQVPAWGTQFDTGGMDLVVEGSDGQRATKVSDGIRFSGAETDYLGTGYFEPVAGAKTFYIVARVESFLSNAKLISFSHSETLDLRNGAVYEYRWSLYGSSAIGITDKYVGEADVFNIIKVVLNNGVNSSLSINRAAKATGDIGTRMPRWITVGAGYLGSAAFTGTVAAFIARDQAEADGSPIDDAIFDFYNDNYVHFPVSAVIENATPGVVNLRWNEPIDPASVGNIGDFYVASKSIASVAASPDGYGVDITLNIPVDNTYSGTAGTNEEPSAGGLKTASGAWIPYSRIPIVNNVE